MHKQDLNAKPRAIDHSQGATKEKKHNKGKGLDCLMFLMSVPKL